MALQLDDTGKNTVEQDKNHRGRDYFDGPVGMNLPSNAEDVGSIPGQGTEIPHVGRNVVLFTRENRTQPHTLVH